MSTARRCPVCERKNIFTDEDAGQERECVGCGFVLYVYPKVSISQQIKNALGLGVGAIYFLIVASIGVLVLTAINYILWKTLGIGIGFGGNQ